MHSPDWRAWRARFDARATRPLPDVSPPTLPAAQRAALAASLAVFQLGEAGEGRIAHQIDRCTLSAIDDDYRAALKRFVAEEGRHGRILGQMVRATGGQLARHNWTEGLFRHGRRLMGVRLKLLVLLAAEVVAVVFYAALAQALPRSPLRQALLEIVDDEAIHLDFHVAFFQTQTPGLLARGVFAATWWAVCSAACLVVAWDHRRTLAAFAIDRRALLSRCWQAIRHVADRVVYRSPSARRSCRLTARETATLGPPRTHAR